MSSIVQLIGEITGQINLLVPNATIESARAGEAGPRLRGGGKYRRGGVSQANSE
jgi:hypothetical protein